MKMIFFLQDFLLLVNYMFFFSKLIDKLTQLNPYIPVSMSLTTVSMPPTTVTLSQCNSAIAVGDFLSPVRKNQIYQNIQIACNGGRLLGNQLAVGLIL